LKDQIKRYEMAQILKRKRKFAEKEIQVKKKDVVRATEKELADMRTMLNHIHEMNSQAHESDGIKRNNLLNRIQREKFKLRNKFKKYTQFTYKMPTEATDIHYKVETHKYNKVDSNVQTIINELNNIKEPDVELVEQYKQIFGGFN
jgi:hypothetical protein